MWSINFLVEPSVRRDTLQSELMPLILLNKTEIQQLLINAPENLITSQIKNGATYLEIIKLGKAKNLNKKSLIEAIPFIDEATRNYLILRPTKEKSVTKPHIRRKKENQ